MSYIDMHLNDLSDKHTHRLDLKGLSEWYVGYQFSKSN